MKKVPLPTAILTLWNHFTAYQKSFLVYFSILFVLLLTIPFIKISYLNSTQVDTFGLLNTYFSKTAIIMLLTTVFMIIYIISPKFKHWLHKIFGFTGNEHLTIPVGLLVMLVALFSMGDTVTLIKQHMSPRISTTKGFLFVGIVLILGIVRSLMLARIEHKKLAKSTEVNVKQDNDDTEYTPTFEQAKKEFEGLFGEEQQGQ